MIYIETDSEGAVSYIHNFPFHQKYGLNKSEYELRESGYLVNSIPKPENISGKVGVLKYDGKNFYYEYIDRPLTPEEKIEQLEGSIMELTMLIASMGGSK